MTGIHPDELRISDSEREHAISALGEHLSSGRLGLEEYGDRTAQVTVARTRGELMALFTDLPAPKPRFDLDAPAAPVKVSTVDTGEPERRAARSPQRRQRQVRAALHVARVALLATVAVLFVMHVFVPVLFFVAIFALMSSRHGGGRWGGPGGRGDSFRSSDHRSHPAFSAGYNSRSYRGRPHRGRGFQGHARA